jgi:uncharacterized membrane protein
VIASNRGSLSGDWTEATHNVAGQLVGTLSGYHIRSRVQAAQFTAMLSISVIGDALRVTLIPQAGDIREIEAIFRRG